MDQLHISNEFRNRGIGKKLFLMLGKTAKSRGADKFYLCAGSAEETIAFYFSIGCKETEEINQELFQLDKLFYFFIYACILYGNKEVASLLRNNLHYIEPTFI